MKEEVEATGGLRRGLSVLALMKKVTKLLFVTLVSCKIEWFEYVSSLHTMLAL